MPLAVRKRVVGAKTEGTPGTAESITTAEGTMRLFEPKISYDIPYIGMPQQGSSSEGQGETGARSGRFTAFSYLHGKGSSGVPAYVTALMLSCGCVNTDGVITPVTGVGGTSTIRLYQDGRVKGIAGAVGNFKIGSTGGGPARIDWDFLGKYQAPASTSLLAPTYAGARPPRTAGATITIGGSTYKLGAWEFDAGVKPVLIEDEGDATFFAYAYAATREPVFTCKLMSVLHSTHDFYADLLASTQVAISIAIGADANNTMTLAMPKAQLMNPPADEEDKGYLVDALTFKPCANSSAGDNEWSLTYT